MSKHLFRITLQYLDPAVDNDDPGTPRVNVEHEFDPDDIYDGELGAVVRGLARMAQVEAGVRENSSLAP